MMDLLINGVGDSTIYTHLAKWYLRLRPVDLPSYYIERKPMERANMEYQDECGPRGFHFFFRSLDLQGRNVLDFGCGFGGRSVRFREKGALTVTGIEVLPDMIAEASAFGVSKGISGLRFLVAKGERLPFQDNSFDVICSYEVFEHVGNLEACLRECFRVLAKGGNLYGVFPPFYHPTGGSHLHGYISKSPAANVLFSCKVLRQAVRQLMAERGQSYLPPVIHPDEPLWSVNGTTIRGFKRIIRDIPFSIKNIRLLPMISPVREKWDKWRMKYWATPFKVLPNIPFINEVFTDRIVMVLQK
jgi:SAM-dependent methyltransferase